ncbi:MAG: methylmalonyl Co-A mutase-associated GTPase MeaB [Bacteroidales bacterium]|nr:methylmalonyl Co-A mutase-associated GTPase MeaB [Bacteroidales bacterium]
MNKDNHNKSALKVNKGIVQPSTVNKEALVSRSKVKKELTVDNYIQGIRDGNRSILAKAITLIESALPKHRILAQDIIEACLPLSGKSIRIGISGVPGVGKSTFIEAFGKNLTEQKHKVAVLAIDPSSSRSKGSILGDKTRMESLSRDKNAFIRPSPSAGSLGGVAQKTRETIILCEAAGFDIILVETVGVGQSETAVHSMVDFFLLLMLSGAGDELQGIKRGIMEMSDALIINKADGDNIDKAKMAKVQYANALHLFPPTPSGWTPQTDICSAYTGDGIDRVWDIIQEYIQLTQTSDYFTENRKQQEIQRLLENVEQRLLNQFYENPKIHDFMEKAKNSIANSERSVYSLIDELFKHYNNTK